MVTARFRPLEIQQPKQDGDNDDNQEQFSSLLSPHKGVTRPPSALNGKRGSTKHVSVPSTLGFVTCCLAALAVGGIAVYTVWTKLSGLRTNGPADNFRKPKTIVFHGIRQAVATDLKNLLRLGNNDGDHNIGTPCDFPCRLIASDPSDSHDKGFWDRADAVVLQDDIPANVHQWRRRNQRFVYFRTDPQESVEDDTLKEEKLRSKRMELNGFFNWTMTYRLDSDIIHPLGYVIPLHEPKMGRKKRKDVNDTNIVPYDSDLIQASTGKLDVVAAIIDHDCSLYKTDAVTISQNKTFWESYLVDKLKQHQNITVNHFGHCPKNKPCSLDEEGEAGEYRVVSCWDKLHRYKVPFLMVTDNTMMKDYIPPDVFKAFQNGFIPILLANSFSDNSSDEKRMEEKGLPPSSIFDLTRYSGTNRVAMLLKQSAIKLSMVQRYHEWRKSYTVRPSSETLNPNAICELCTKLQFDSDDFGDENVISDWNKWWEAGRPARHTWTFLKMLFKD